MQTKGFEELSKKLDQLKNIDRVKVALAGGWFALAEMNMPGVCPVDTGNMRASSYVEPFENSGASIVYDTDYAFYVEEKVGWVRSTLDEKSTEIEQKMTDELKKQIGEVIK